MRNVAVIGAGVSPFGRLDKLLYQEIGRPAVNDAIDNSGIDRKLIQSCYYGTCGGVGVGHEIMNETGLIGIPITQVVNACSSSSNAFRLAFMDIASGMSDCVIAMGIEKMKDVSMAVVGGGTRFQIEGKAYSYGFPIAGGLGGGMAAGFALLARGHIKAYGTKNEDLANIVVKSRKNASKNPKAEFQNPMSMDEVLNDVMINDPLTRSQCCPRTDGAAAVILMSEEWVKKYRIDTPVWIKGSAMGSQFLLGETEKPYYGFTTDVKISRTAFKMAGVEPKDFYKKGFGECHDCFSISELVHYEDFGFCKKGDGAHMINDGIVEIDGDLPLNPSGGLLSCGHPLGATGVRQIAEILFQMRKDKEVAKRQVPDKHLDIAFTHTLGQPGLGFTNVMHVFSRNL
ncbi:MAG: thiolase domain-containing protein [Promethearchaeota archaeon]